MNIKDSLNATSDSTRSVIVTLLLVFSLFIRFPLLGIIGFILMWIWTSWPKWIKIVLTIPFVLELLSFLLLIGYVLFLRPFQVNGEAMVPTYKNGAYLVTHIVRSNEVIKRGDIVIFKAPPTPTKDFIKRVIGFPGDTVMLQKGDVYINGQKLDESSYLNPNIKTYGETFLKEGQTVTVPSGQYFMLGDNRQYSSDSRDWGFVPQANIISKVVFCYWSCK